MMDSVLGPADSPPPPGRWYDVQELMLNPANPRGHNQKNVSAIKESLARFGQQKPIVVGPDLVVDAGNGTLLAARELGWRYLWGRETDLTGSDRTAYGIADNRAGELAEWDDDVLAEQLGGLREEGFDLDSLGFDDSDVGRLLGGVASPDGFPEVDESIATEHECPKCGYRWSGGA